MEIKNLLREGGNFHLSSSHSILHIEAMKGKQQMESKDDSNFVSLFAFQVSLAPCVLHQIKRQEQKGTDNDHCLQQPDRHGYMPTNPSISHTLQSNFSIQPIKSQN